MRGAGAAAMNRVPSFFVIGPPRTGTSWLHEVLKHHVVLPALTKETRFFDLQFHRGFGWYGAHYAAPSNNQITGEIAPTYFASEAARDRIARAIPEARIICIFRNPLERIVSLYRLKCAYGLIPWSFEQAILRDHELMESSKYATHLKAWQRTLGAERVLPAVYDDLEREPQSFVDALVDFIGIPRFTLSSSQAERAHASASLTRPGSYLRTHSAMILADKLRAWRLDAVVNAVKKSPLKKWLLGGGPEFAKPAREALLALCERLRPEVEELERLLSRDLSSWKSLEEDLSASPEPLPEVLAAASASAASAQER